MGFLDRGRVWLLSLLARDVFDESIPIVFPYQFHIFLPLAPLCIQPAYALVLLISVLTQSDVPGQA
jgi:hypothetical protein